MISPLPTAVREVTRTRTRGRRIRRSLITVRVIRRCVLVCVCVCVCGGGGGGGGGG